MIIHHIHYIHSIIPIKFRSLSYSYTFSILAKMVQLPIRTLLERNRKAKREKKENAHKVSGGDNLETFMMNMVYINCGSI